MASISQQLVRRMSSARAEMSDIAHNLSNSNTPGFKRLMSVYQNDAGSRNEAGRSAGQGGYEPASQIRQLDMGVGELEQTGRELDLSIEEPNGFFAIGTPSGRRYTRHGRFRVNSDGVIVNPAGHALQTQQGELRVPPDANKITVRPEGEVRVDGNRIGDIPVYKFADPGSLKPEGGTLYDPGEETAEVTQANTILQGMIEKSNVKPMNELVRLMSSSRAYENSMQIRKRLGDVKRSLVDRIA